MIFRAFLLIFGLYVFASQAWAAGQGEGSIEVLAGGKRFYSFQEYTQLKNPLSVEEPAVEPVAEPVPEIFSTPRVAGVNPSVGEIVRDFHDAPAAGMVLHKKQEFAAALAQAVDGKTGPILLVADGNKVRMMELKSK